METHDAYLRRKRAECALLSQFLACEDSKAELHLPSELIAAKFALAARLRALHSLNNWQCTETGWSSTDLKALPYAVAYAYQRFDLQISGPPIYPRLYALWDGAAPDSWFTGSGMSAVAATMFSISRAVPRANIHVPPGAYFETAHLVRAYMPNLRLHSDGDVIQSAPMLPDAATILLIDSFAPGPMLDGISAAANNPIDLAIFDTSCLPAGSGRLRRVVAWANRHAIPLVMVRSHLKLDMLGTEYGRLGSICVAPGRTDWPDARQLLRQKIVLGVRDAICLLGATAQPGALPPFCESGEAEPVHRQRHACALANMRRLRSCLRTTKWGKDSIQFYQHGCFLTLLLPPALSRPDALHYLERLLMQLDEAGIPAKRAGSFGFDFIAVDLFHDIWRKREALRLSIADLPAEMIRPLADLFHDWVSSLDEAQSMMMPG